VVGHEGQAMKARDGTSVGAPVNRPRSGRVRASARGVGSGSVRRRRSGVTAGRVRTQWHRCSARLTRTRRAAGGPSPRPPLRRAKPANPHHHQSRWERL